MSLEEVLKKIEESPVYDEVLLQRLSCEVNMMEEWLEADGENFESVYRKMIKIGKEMISRLK